MNSCRSLIAVILAFVTCCSVDRTIAVAHAESVNGESRHKVATAVLANGAEVVSNGLHERVVALRDDVVRIRVWRGNTPPEDASWAVLPLSRSGSVPVKAQNSGRTCEFRTGKLIIQIDKASLALTIQDLDGVNILEDARPIRFDGDAFRIYKTMPLDEHYFGLGDKVGPLDRRNQAFTLWNTDAYRFQEIDRPSLQEYPLLHGISCGSSRRHPARQYLALKLRLRQGVA